MSTSSDSHTVFTEAWLRDTIPRTGVRPLGQTRLRLGGVLHTQAVRLHAGDIHVEVQAG